MEENINTNSSRQKPIDLIKVWNKVWSARKQYFIVLPIVFVATYLLTFGIPKTYSCSVELAPELVGKNSSGSLGSLASAIGNSSMSKLLNGSATNDAINPLLYPDLLKSPDFIVTLFPIQVTTKKGKTYSYYEYISEHQKMPIWTKYIINPILDLLPKDDADAPKPKGSKGKKGGIVDVRHMTKREDGAVTAIANKISCVVDKKTEAISITVKDQDPEVCATIGDSVLTRMQDFIVEYRTKKARIDYNHYKALLNDAERQYGKALGNYAGFSDSHRNAIDQNVIAQSESNSKRMNLKYQSVSALTLQLQNAESKIQENTPAFTVLRSATLPQKPAGPKKMRIALVMTFLAAIIVTARVLLRKEQKNIV